MTQVFPYSNYFSAFTDNQGGIHVQDYNGTRQIGVSLERYREMESVANEAVAKADEYHKRLVDAGLMEAPMTTEEQLALLTRQVTALTQQVSQMTTQGVRDGLDADSATRKNVSAAAVGVADRSGATNGSPVQSDKKRRP